MTTLGYHQDGQAVEWTSWQFQPILETTVEVPEVVYTRRNHHQVKKTALEVERFIEVPDFSVPDFGRIPPGCPLDQRKACSVAQEPVKYVHAPNQLRNIERTIEVPVVKEVERLVHRPVEILQERIIQLPKPVFVERVSYNDRYEYREVLVDTVVEVPEVQYIYEEVPHYIPQQYIQEYYVDKVMEVPQVEVEELHAEEQVTIDGWTAEEEVLKRVPVVRSPTAREMQRRKSGIDFAPPVAPVPQSPPPSPPLPFPSMPATSACMRPGAIAGVQTSMTQSMLLPAVYASYAPIAPPMYTSPPSTPPLPCQACSLPVSGSVPQHAIPVPVGCK